MSELNTSSGSAESATSAPARSATGVIGDESAGKSDPRAKPARTAAQQGRPDHYRETVESIVVAFVLAFLFRTFEAEAFVIPTGSMAPTLYGQHRDVYCKKCGTRFSVGASDEVDRPGIINPEKRSDSAVCHNCRYPNPVLTSEIFNGDRILVNKFPYEISTPERWDVIVFKNPNEAKTNYIKRLAALPGEEVRIEWGDVYVRTGEAEPFKIPRKKPEKQRQLQIPVYDDDHPPRILLEAGWPERWAGDTGARWAGDPQKRAYRIDPDPMSPDRLHWLRYRHLVPGSDDWSTAEEKQPLRAPSPMLITDFYAYNAKITVREAEFNKAPLPDLDAESLGVQWVGDLTISCNLELLAAEGELQCELVESERRYRCRIDLKTGMASLFYINDQVKNEEDAVVRLVEAETDIKAVGEYTLSFANVDDRICLWVNDRLVRFVEFDPGARHTPQAPPIFPTERDLSPVGFGARGASVVLSQLRLERDIYYRYSSLVDGDEYSPPHNSQDLRDLLSDPQRWAEHYNSGRKVGRYQLKDDPDDLEDEFFVLGDNSPRSLDSRLWKDSPGVPRRLLIGKAFFIYWPHAIPFMNDGKGYPGQVFKEQTNRGTIEARPRIPRWSVPFYPQGGRMHRIR